MPQADEIEQMFAALVSNGMEFVETSIDELAAKPQFSVAHFATGIELLLKARLFREHWTLVATNPHACSWTGLKDGTDTTVAASELCSVIRTVIGTPLTTEKQIFRSVFEHRNRVLHFIPSDDRAGIAAEQCRAWHVLHALLRRRWATIFADFADQIDAVDAKLLAHRPYLQVRFDASWDRLNGLASAGRVFDCPSCHFRSAVLPDKSRTVSEFECPVCKAEGHVVLASCGARVSLEEIPLECACGKEHDREELLESLDPTPVLRPKEQLLHEADRAYCGECLDFEVSVGPQAGGYVCVNCGVEFEANALSRCECCNELWVGYDTEFSYYTGCEWCDGNAPKG